MENSVWSETLQVLDASLPPLDQWSITLSPTGNVLSLIAKDMLGVDSQGESAPQTRSFLYGCNVALSPSTQAGRAVADLRFNVTWNGDGQVLAVFSFGTSSKVKHWSSKQKKNTQAISSKNILLRLRAPIPAGATSIPFTVYALVETNSSDGVARFQVDTVDFERY